MSTRSERLTGEFGSDGRERGMHLIINSNDFPIVRQGKFPACRNKCNRTLFLIHSSARDFMLSIPLIISVLIAFGWCTLSSASPLLPRQSAASVASPRTLEIVRWRHRYRRGDDADDRRPGNTDRYETDGSNADAGNRPFIKMIRPEGRRRGRWVDPPPLK